MGSSFVVAAEESCGGVQVCGIEEIEAKWWMDGASKHIVDGRFQSALSLLRKAQQLCPTLKGLPELTAISQVCYAGSWRACSCSSRRELCQTPDWYRILEVSLFFPSYLSESQYRKEEGLEEAWSLRGTRRKEKLTDMSAKLLRNLLERRIDQHVRKAVEKPAEEKN